MQDITAATRRRGPRRLARLFRGLAIGLPALVLWLTAQLPVSELAGWLEAPVAVDVGAVTRGAMIGLALLPVLATSLALEALRGCALAVDAGRGMTLEAARRLRAAGSWMLVASVAALVVPTLAGLLLSAPTGHLVIRVNIESGVVLPLVLAGALRLIAGVIVEAAALADDHAQIV